MEELKKRIQEMIDEEKERRVQFLCSEQSPFGMVLRTALTRHDTPQCKVVCFTEGMYSWYKISKEPFYLELATNLVEYSNLVFQNRLERKFFRDLILDQWLAFSNEEFPYLRMKVLDRMKSLISEINDLVDKTLKGYIVLDFVGQAEKLFKEDEREEAQKILEEFFEKYADSRNKDIYGSMFILQYHNRVRDEDNPEFLRESALRLGKNCIKFMKQNAVQVLSLKDYISNPKGNGYQSYQFVIRGTNNPLEVQIRSLSMHHHNEDPSSPAYHGRYKDTTFNNFLNSIVDDIYGVAPEYPKTFEEEMAAEKIRDNRYGVTDGIPLFSIDQIARTPNALIPANVDELKKFEDIEALAELYARTKSNK